MNNFHTKLVLTVYAKDYILSVRNYKVIDDTIIFESDNKDDEDLLDQLINDIAVFYIDGICYQISYRRKISDKFSYYQLMPFEKM